MSTLFEKKDKKILLVAINAKYIHSNLAVYSLQAYAKEHLCYSENDNFTIEVAEYTINQDPDKVVEDLYNRAPDFIALSCYIWNISYVRELIPTLKILMPGLAIWLGGPEVSYHPKQWLKKLPIEGIMIGEGEKTFTRLLEAYSKERNLQANFGQSNEAGPAGPHFLSSIPGICTDRFENPPEEALNMDDLPFVYRDWPDEKFENRIVYYETSRGCPYRCSYCLSSVDKHVRFRSMELVKAELQFFLDRQVKQVKFVDRTFNCDDRRAIEIWQFIRDHDNGITNFHFEIAAKTLSEEALSLISTLRPGLIQLEVGVQTTNVDTLQLINRHDDYDRIGYVSGRVLENQNIHLHLDLIAGLPEEDYRSFANSFNQVYNLHPHELQLGFLKVLKGTQIEAEAEHYGIKYNAEPPYEVLKTKDISYAELRRLKAVAEMLEVHYNSGQFMKSMEYLVSLEKTPFALYERLADYYHEKGFDLMQPSRSKRYLILLDFYKSTYADAKSALLTVIGGSELTVDGEQYMKECLIYDLYARENLKSRPDYAGEPVHMKTLLKALNLKFAGSENNASKSVTGDEIMDEKRLRYDFHGEAFTVLFGKPVVCLFDYRNRNPVTGNVQVTDITEDMSAAGL